MRVCVRSESWQIAGGFRLARGARSAAEVVVLELEQDGLTGRSECVPYARYGESVAIVRHAIEAACASMGDRPSREALQTTMPAGAARNAVDCALWDLEAKRAGIPVWQLAGLRQAPAPLRTMRTLSIDTPERMGRAAQRLADPTIIKLKVDGTNLDEVIALLPALKSPTVSKLFNEDAYAVETVVAKREINILIPALKDAGATGIIELPIAKIVH